jgi:predicted transposase YdaD
MVVLRESPWYQEILQEGERRGLEQGLERSRSLLLRLLSRRFGAISEQVRLKIDGLSFDELEALAEAQIDFSGVADLTQWLEQR